MKKQAIETYPTYDGLGDIISETRAWYRALGLQMGGSLYSVIRAAEGITGLVHAIAKTLKMEDISKKVHVIVEDIPAIAYITPNAGQTIVHVGSWLYSRKKMVEWLPEVNTMSENDMLVLALGLINGAVALDMIARSTETIRKDGIERVVNSMRAGYSRSYESIYAVETERATAESVDVDEKYIYISSAIHDILAIKACLTEFGNSSWIMFPLLLFRTLFNDGFAHYAKELIEHDDTIDNLVACVSALRCFSSHSASILEVKTSIGINLIKSLLAGTLQDIHTNSSVASSVISEEMLSAYIKEIRRTKNEMPKQESGDGKGDKKDKKDKKENGDNTNGESRDKNGLVKGIAPTDASTPVNEDVAKNSVKEASDFKKFDKSGEPTGDIDYMRADVQESVSQNKKARAENASEEKNWLEHFMQLAFSGKIKFNNDTLDGISAPRSFKSVSEYVESVRPDESRDGYSYYNNRESLETFAENVLAVYNSVDKVSLNNLFMERTMDIEKSQPARSGIALIPTRIVNMFTDEKIFSPLPENETERNSEVIILVDASGSMRGHYLRVMENGGKQRLMPLYDAVVGAARAIADGLQRANVNCSVFAHSTLSDNDCAFICKLADPYSFDRQNDFANAGKIKSRNNADSYAIDEVAKYFSQDGRDIGRTLIVLSDGQPAFSGYRNDRNGDKLTREAADKLREDGVKVYSISLIESVVNDNNRIYGKKNNFFPVDEQSGNVISLSSMLKKIVDVVAANSQRSADNVLTQG